MKGIALKLAFISLMFFSLGSYADNKVVISGEPVALELHDNVYHLPPGYSVTTDYHYVTIDGTRRVCYAETRPDLVSLNVMTINVVVDDQSHKWFCYEYNPEFFTVTTSP